MDRRWRGEERGKTVRAHGQLKARQPGACAEVQKASGGAHFEFLDKVGHEGRGNLLENVTKNRG